MTTRFPDHGRLPGAGILIMMIVSRWPGRGGKEAIPGARGIAPGGKWPTRGGRRIIPGGGLAVACLLLAAALLLAACGGGHQRNRMRRAYRAAVVDIYSSMPLHGRSRAQAVAVENGIRLALAQAGARAGRFRVHYIPLDDSTASAGGWEPGQVAADARLAAVDPDAVYYIGELDSDASEVSIPILNQAGIPQVSPTNRYVGLTRSLPGSGRDEPGRYYPAGVRTYLRIMPNDSVQAAADLLAMRQSGCSKVAIAGDGGRYGRELTALLEAEKGLYGVDVVSSTAFGAIARDLRGYADAARSQGVECLFIAGADPPSAVQITRLLHAVLPAARIFTGDALCTGSFTSPLAASFTSPPSGRAASPIDRLLACTRPTLAVAAYPEGGWFSAAYRARFGGSSPDPYALYGYESMKLALDTIAGLGPQGDSRSALLRALFAIRDRRSVLGTYGFDRDGDTTLRSYGLYRPGPDGTPAFSRVLVPARVI